MGGTPDLAVFFEEVVNTVAKHAPGSKLLFNSSPTPTLDAAEWGVPDCVALGMDCGTRIVSSM